MLDLLDANDGAMRDLLDDSDDDSDADSIDSDRDLSQSDSVSAYVVDGTPVRLTQAGCVCTGPDEDGKCSVHASCVGGEGRGKRVDSVEVAAALPQPTQLPMLDEKELTRNEVLAYMDAPYHVAADRLLGSLSTQIRERARTTWSSELRDSLTDTNKWLRNLATNLLDLNTSKREKTRKRVAVDMKRNPFYTVPGNADDAADQVVAKFLMYVRVPFLFANLCTALADWAPEEEGGGETKTERESSGYLPADGGVCPDTHIRFFVAGVDAPIIRCQPVVPLDADKAWSEAALARHRETAHRNRDRKDADHELKVVDRVSEISKAIEGIQAGFLDGFRHFCFRGREAGRLQMKRLFDAFQRAGAHEMAAVKAHMPAGAFALFQRLGRALRRVQTLGRQLLVEVKALIAVNRGLMDRIVAQCRVPPALSGLASSLRRWRGWVLRGVIVSPFIFPVVADTLGETINLLAADRVVDTTAAMGHVVIALKKIALHVATEPVLITVLGISLIDWAMREKGIDTALFFLDNRVAGLLADKVPLGPLSAALRSVRGLFRWLKANPLARRTVLTGGLLSLLLPIAVMQQKVLRDWVGALALNAEQNMVSMAGAMASASHAASEDGVESAGTWVAIWHEFRDWWSSKGDYAEAAPTIGSGPLAIGPGGSGEDSTAVWAGEEVSSEVWTDDAPDTRVYVGDDGYEAHELLATYNTGRESGTPTARELDEVAGVQVIQALMGNVADAARTLSHVSARVKNKAATTMMGGPAVFLLLLLLVASIVTHESADEMKDEMAGKLKMALRLGDEAEIEKLLEECSREGARRRREGFDARADDTGFISWFRRS